jgi:diguanylate cyclase (GGDEF)-like protein/PAS domain S-box-containing protein
MMPGMNGYDVCRALKAEAATKMIPVIFVTSLLNSGDEILGFEVGCVDFITKPVIPSIVRTRVQTHLALKQKHDELEAQNGELRRVRNELEVSLNEYAILYDFAPVGYVTLDVRGHIRDVNLTCARLLDLEAQLPVDTPFVTFIDEAEGRDVFQRHIDAVMQNREVQKCEIRLTKSNGEVIYGILRSIKINDIDSADGFILCSIVDDTAAKKVQEERTQLALIVESSHDAIFSVSLDDRITSWNSGAEKIFGYSGTEIIGSQIFSIIPSQRYNEKSKILHTVLRGELIKHFEITHAKKDGCQIYVSITISPTLDLHGELSGYSVIASDVTDRKTMEETIRHQAFHDTLTDLPNRQLFMDVLSLGLSQARRSGKNLALLFLDLNGFKNINDAMGHGCGDLLLQEVALRLKNSIRDSDTVARLGGDEFMVVMPDLAQRDDISIVLKKILRVFETPFLLNGIPVTITSSIGISLFPEDGECSEVLIKKADTAMYEAKKSDRKLFQFCNAKLNTRAIAMLERDEQAMSLITDASHVTGNNARSYVGKWPEI